MSGRTDLGRLEDMRSALADIRALTGDDRDAFLRDRTAQQAVAFNLAVLGEAARALSDDLRERHPEVPWREVIGQRHVVIHEYHRLDLDAIWNTASEDVPRLENQLERIEDAERA